jgi:Reverse transcriptase (RNA-dependent DNA polymerase)
MHLQYADDTLLFIKDDLIMLERVKWSLRVFEGLSGLKINFTKSALILLNLDDLKSYYYDSILNCSLGKLPIKYLGVNLHWKKPSKHE